MFLYVFVFMCVRVRAYVRVCVRSVYALHLRLCDCVFVFGCDDFHTQS